MLEQRGLVVKHPLVVKRPGGGNYFTAHVQTNMLHLPRFAPPDVTKGAVMTVRGLHVLYCTAASVVFLPVYCSRWTGATLHALVWPGRMPRCLGRERRLVPTSKPPVVWRCCCRPEPRNQV